jgi:hypothetical protein
VRRLSSVIAVVAAATVAIPAAWAASSLRYATAKDATTKVSLRVTHDRRLVTRMTISYRVSCDNGGSATRSTLLRRLPVTRSGRFAFSGSYVGSQDGSDNHVRLHGTVTRKRASGTFKLRATKGSLHCQSKTVHWRAHRVR